MTVWSRRLLLPLCLLQMIMPLAHRVFNGAVAIGDADANTVMRPPEQPPGAFFAIWGVIFIAMLVCGVSALARDTTLSRQIAPPLALSAGLGSIWMGLEQVAPDTLFGFVVLCALTASAGWGALRFDRMRGLGGSPAKFWADLATGLLAGWMSVALAISLPDLARSVLGLGPTDAVWGMLALTLAAAGAGTWLASRFITRSGWFFVAMAWGLAGLVINNWSLTQLHVPALAVFAFGCALFWMRLTRGARGAVAS